MEWVAASNPNFKGRIVRTEGEGQVSYFLKSQHFCKKALTGFSVYNSLMPKHEDRENRNKDQSRAAKKWIHSKGVGQKTGNKSHHPPKD